MSIGDYALIGNCRTAALVSRSGSIDWLCLPAFDSPSVFGSLLDSANGGSFRIRPAGPYRTERQYLANTNVLETVFHCETGTFLLRDAMMVSVEGHRHGSPVPEHEVLREVEMLDGEAEIEVLYQPRPDYACKQAILRDRGSFGIWSELDGGAIALRGDVPLRVGEQRNDAGGTFRLVRGERVAFSLVYTSEAPASLPPLGGHARRRMEETSGWWRSWASRCRYDGPYRDAVVRSALVLKLLSFAPSGAIIAAPTTSLPEALGGEQNWDYRYCWLRDASFTLHALLDLGYREEGEAFLSWILHTTRMTWPELQVVYDVYGRPRLPETHLDHLAGYAGSRPVRIGNDASGQLQLDVYGEVADAVHLFASAGGSLDQETQKLLRGIGDTVMRRWREPDDGIWEVRSGRQHNTHSRALCWVALDRLIALAEGDTLDGPVDRWRHARDEIRSSIEEHGYNTDLEAYTRMLDGDELDASLLLLGLYGYVPPTHPRMRSTCKRIAERLGDGPLVRRYSTSSGDGLPPGEGAFGIASFWAVECDAQGGEIARANAHFEALLGYANDVGLLGEEIDVNSGEVLGNFPQAFTHVGLINAAITLEEMTRDEQRPNDAPEGKGDMER